MRKVSNIKHILIVRLSAMGDVAMLPHALRAFQEVYGSVKVTVVTKELFKPFFKDLNVDFFIPQSEELDGGVRGILRMVNRASLLRVDAIVDVHDVVRTKIFRAALWLQGVRCSHIKKDRDEKKKYIKNHSINSLPPLKHAVVRYCDAIRALGFEFDNPTPAIKPQRPNPMGEKSGVWIGVAPFSAHEGKIYPLEKMERNIEQLSLKYDRVFIHSGGGDELEFAQKMESRHQNVTALFGRIKLAEEIDLISHLDCVVTMDSLVMHLASLMATPAVSVWGATHPSLGFLGYGFDMSGVVGLDDLECRPCSIYGNLECQFGDYRCMNNIDSQRVVDMVESVLQKSRS